MHMRVMITVPVFIVLIFLFSYIMVRYSEVIAECVSSLSGPITMP